MGKLDKVAKAVEKGKEAPLIKLMNDKDKEVVLAAIEAAGKIGKDDSFNVLIVQLTSSDAAIRAASAAALGVMGNDHARAHLTHSLENEKDPVVIAALKNSIQSLRNAKD